jgi:hypothetical protein
MTEVGILYFAKGNEFVSEARLSAKRTKDHMDCPITLVTNSEIDPDYIDNVIIDNREFSKADKPRCLLKSPYEKTIFLDSDIWLEDSISELFDILSRFDLALVKDPMEGHIYHMEYTHPIDGVPKAFPEYNTGVLAFRKSSDVEDLFEEWNHRCGPDTDRDQLPFRSALYHSTVRFTSLRTEYNCMYRAHNALNGPVKVFHGQLTRSENNHVPIEEAVEKLNKNPSDRVSYHYSNNLKTIPPISKLSQFYSICAQKGVVEAIKRVKNTYIDN